MGQDDPGVYQGTGDSAWADLEDIGLGELKESMRDPEFSLEGMLVAEIDGQIAGIVDAHISPSFSEFCVLRILKVKSGYWNLAAQSLLDAALNSSAKRNAKIVEACLPEEAETDISLLQNNGFTLEYIDCGMGHSLKDIPRRTNQAQIRKYAEVNDPVTVVNLQNAIFKGITGRPVTEEEFLYWMKNPRFECFTAFLDRKPVASCFCETKTVRGEEHGWIYGLGVLPDYRRLKIGTALLSTVLMHLRSTGANCAFVSTDYDSYLQRFYEATGFRVVRKTMALRKHLNTE